jgi:tripartite ATP-independent transporter DctM subunit
LVIGTSTLLILFIGILLFFFVLGFPVAFSLGLTAVALMLMGVGGGLNEAILVSRMFRGVNSFVLLSIPFFLFAGRIMNAGGITERIFRFCQALVGSTRGGLGHVNVVASMVFAGMSGVAVADAAGLGPIEYKAMTDAGYPPEFAAGVTAASSTIGPIIPPSVPLVIYAILANVSVGACLIGGIVPGVLIGITLMIMVAYTARVQNFPQGAPFDWVELKESFKDSFLALITPLILIGGIISGYFTATEASAVAVLYAMILALFIFKEVSPQELWEMVKQTMVDSAAVTFLVATANAYGYLAVRTRLPIILAEQMTAISENPLVLLMIINVFLLIVGLFMETIAALTILVPILAPLINMVGIDPVHFGVVMVFNLMIGLLTPPFGSVLFVLSKSIDLSLERIIKGVVPFYFPLLLALLLMTFFPGLVTWLPSLFFG